MSIGDSSCDNRFKIIKRLETGSISQNVVYLVEDTKSKNEKFRDFLKSTFSYTFKNLIGK